MYKLLEQSHFAPQEFQAGTVFFITKNTELAANPFNLAPTNISAFHDICTKENGTDLNLKSHCHLLKLSVPIL